MRELYETDYEKLNKCPWCGEQSSASKILYVDDLNCPIVKCNNCGIIYAKNRLNSSGLDKYWEDYETRVHVADKKLTEERQVMYKIDFDFVKPYLDNLAKHMSAINVLDIGCGNGEFLNYFEDYGCKTEGVEFGKKAAELAEQHHIIHYGEFDKMDFGDKEYDLVIFRGVLQYIPYPKEYLKKAKSILSEGGYIFITAQPNLDSLAARLFGKNFRLSVTGTDFIGYNEKVLTEYMKSENLDKVGERYFYPETPYANEEEDLMLMAKALKNKQENKIIDFKSPAFWGNMMTLVYKKQIGYQSSKLNIGKHHEKYNRKIY